MDHHTTLTLRRELHTYLGNIPGDIRQNQDKALPGLCISIGNCLKFIGPLLERGAKPIPSPDDQPESLCELGEKFRELGLELWDVKPKINSVGRDLSDIKDKISTLQKHIQVLIEGGAK